MKIFGLISKIFEFKNFGLKLFWVIQVFPMDFSWLKNLLNTDRKLAYKYVYKVTMTHESMIKREIECKWNSLYNLHLEIIRHIKTRLRFIWCEFNIFAINILLTTGTYTIVTYLKKVWYKTKFKTSDFVRHFESFATAAINPHSQWKKAKF